MIRKSHSPHILILVIFMLVLSACGGSQDAAAPTLDMNLIFTQVAETIAV